MRQTHRTISCGMNDDEKKKNWYSWWAIRKTVLWTTTIFDHITVKKNKHTKTGNLEQKFEAPRSLLYSTTFKWDSSLFDRWWTLFFLHSPIKRSIWLNFKCNSSTAEPFGSSYHSFVHFGASTFHLLLCWLLHKIFTVNCILYVNAQAQTVFSAFLFAFGSFKLPDFDSVLFYFIVYKWEFCACKKKKTNFQIVFVFFPSWLVFPFSICRLSASFSSTSITTVPYTYATSKCTNLCYWNDFSIYLFLGLKKNNEVKTTKAEKSRKILYFIRAQVKDRGQTKRKKKNVNPDALNIFG